MCLLLDMCEEEGVKKGKKSGISLVKRVAQLDAGGKSAIEIAKELQEDIAVIEDIVKSMDAYKRA